MTSSSPTGLFNAVHVLRRKLRRTLSFGPLGLSGPLTPYTPPKKVLLGVVIGIDVPDSPYGAKYARSRSCDDYKKPPRSRRARVTPPSRPNPHARCAPVRFQRAPAPTPTWSLPRTRPRDAPRVPLRRTPYVAHPRIINPWVHGYRPTRIERGFP